MTRGLLVPLLIPRVPRLHPQGRPGSSWTPRGFLQPSTPSPRLPPAHPLSLEPLQLQALLLTLSLPAVRLVGGWQRAQLLSPVLWAQHPRSPSPAGGSGEVLPGEGRGRGGVQRAAGAEATLATTNLR